MAHLPMPPSSYKVPPLASPSSPTLNIQPLSKTLICSTSWTRRSCLMTMYLIQENSAEYKVGSAILERELVGSYKNWCTLLPLQLEVKLIIFILYYVETLSILLATKILKNVIFIHSFYVLYVKCSILHHKSQCLLLTGERQRQFIKQNIND